MSLLESPFSYRRQAGEAAAWPLVRLANAGAAEAVARAGFDWAPSDNGLPVGTLVLNAALARNSLTKLSPVTCGSDVAIPAPSADNLLKTMMS